MNIVNIKYQDLISGADHIFLSGLINKLGTMITSEGVIEARLDVADVGNILRLEVDPGYKLRIPLEAKVLDDNDKSRIVFMYEKIIYVIKTRIS